MANYTPNYNLGKPEPTDPFGYDSFLPLFNDNMDKIDQIGGGGVGDISALAYEQLTELEYNALTPAEKENGVIYFVSDNSTGAKGLTVIRISQDDYNNLTPQEKNNDIPYFVY